MSIIKRFNESSNLEWEEEFETFVDFIYFIQDEYDFIDIQFTTSDGSRKYMDISDYSKKNDVYKRFITALGGMSVKFTITIDIKKDDFMAFKDVIEYIKNERIGASGWEFTEIKISNFKKLKYERAYYIINAEFEWSDPEVHGRKNTYHITGE